MKNNLKTKLLAFIASAAMLLTGCSINITSGSNAVSVDKIRAVACEEQVDTSYQNNVRRAYAGIKVMDDVSEDIETDSGEIVDATIDANYVLIYKNEKDIKLTVDLKNPKKASISALEITCDDEDALIYINDGYGHNSYQKLNGDEVTNVVNWTSSSAVRMTFYMQTTTEADVMTVSITDIKTDAGWQNKTLENNKLEVYKLDDDDICSEFVVNTPEYYECQITHGSNISNLVVTGGEWVGTNHYRIYNDGAMTLEYEFTFNGVTRKWTEIREVELFKTSLLQEALDLDVMYEYKDSINRLDLYFSYAGTGISSLLLSYNSTIYTIEKAGSIYWVQNISDFEDPGYIELVSGTGLVRVSSAIAE